MAGQVAGQLVHVLREVPPRAGNPAYLGLAAQLALDAHLAGHPRHLVGERRVVNEEIKDAPKDGFSKGDTVKLEASHMSGMKGTTANIDNVKKTTVYVVDYKSKDNGKIIKNHKWMTGNELKAR
ncbi:YdhK family protein [Micromonospora chersina]